MNINAPTDLTSDEIEQIQERLDTMHVWGKDLTASMIMQLVARAGGCEYDMTSNPLSPRFVRPESV
jgi:hypothetical protein|tara:strand:- start:274 stop:471 length:198 start_codon:yes stop_codon:yes gene_type:complete